MKMLKEKLKPFWKWLLIVIVLQFGRAFSALKLPEYTSTLVDVGIQNSGFEYAVPLELSDESYQKIGSLMLANEKNDWEASYNKTASGSYELKKEVGNDSDQMAKLNDSFKTPVALYSTLKDERDFSNLDGQITSAERSQLEEDYLKTTDSQTENIAIQQVVLEYEAVGGDIGEVQKSYLKSRAWRMILTAASTLVLSLAVFYIASKISSGVGHQMRIDIYEKVMDFSEAEIKKFSTPSLITRTTNDIQQIQQVMVFFIRGVLYAPILAVGGIIKIVNTQSTMAWYLFIAVAVVMIMVFIIFKLTIPKHKVVQQQFDRVNQVSREILTGLQVIRAFGRQDYETERFDEANYTLQANHLYTARVTSLIQPFIMLTANTLSICIVYFGSQKIGAGAMEIGQMMALITYSMQVVFSFLQISMISMMLPRSIVSFNRIKEVVETPSSIQDKEEPVDLEEANGLVEFKNVDFTFPDAEENTLSNINFTAKPGQTTALIGSTGSGKSTVLHLLMRFYDVTSGSITIDGADIRDLSQEDLHDLIGFVPQEATLFSGTIESNIAYGAPDTSQEDIELAAEIAHAKDFIEEEPYGYQTRVAQGGANFSGGQKQRISIARAIAKKPKIYIFDDSFSALDYQTDASVRQALSEKVTDANVMIVAQRVSTVLNADQIIVMNQGKIDSIGNHLELMESSKIYREIAESQLSEEELSRQAEKIKENEGQVK